MPTTDLPLGSTADRFFNAALWIAQGMVAVGFIVGAYMKVLMPISELAAIWPWAGALPVPIVRILGIIDLAGGLGIIVPALTRIRPNLTVLAAFGCILLQICAIAFHLFRGEADVLPVNFFLLALSAFVLWGRRRFPVKARCRQLRR